MNIAFANSKFFQVREENGLRLIIPAHGAAVGNAAWTPQNVWWRSRVETSAGDTVSQGFGKFFNLGHGPEGLNIGLEDIAHAVERGDALATLKMDGSLLIRSVHNGVVHLRTRGSFGYEHLDNAFEVEDFRQKYPLLFDPSFAANHSLLFEWVSPNNVIVIKYGEPDLTLIGAVDHRAMSYVRMHELASFAVLVGSPLVYSFPLNRKGWEDLYAKLDDEREIEGYVIRLNNEQTLVKVKCAHYLTKHALKSCLTTEKLADMYFQYGRPDFAGFIHHFGESFDEETAMWAMPAISSMYDGIRELLKIEAHIIKKANAARSVDLAKEAAGKSWEVDAIRRFARKEFAIKTQQEYGQTKKFALAMNLYLGIDQKNNDLLKSILLQNTKQTEMSFMNHQDDPDDQEVE